MAEYPRMDPYSKSRYEHGIDAKIVVMGNTGVGKTSLLHRYTQNKFDPRNMTSTTGAFFVTKKVHIDGLKVRLQLWDTAGQERFRSMAPMYYRGANAALLLYDITNAATFEDIRGWLAELKKNCPPELIIYIVGSKADLHHHRQVTSDLARLSLHTWFPPPRAPTPPPPPPPPLSTLSYIRPRFTSFTSIKSVPLNNSPMKSSPPHSASYLDPAVSHSSHSSVLNRCNTGSGLPRVKTTAPTLNRSKTEASHSLQSRFGSHFGRRAGGYDAADSSSNSINEDEEDFDVDDQEWGLHKGMELFEVSAKDDFGIANLFESLINAIIERKDIIERENELRKRDSVFLSTVSAPTWAAQAEEEEAREKARSTSGGWNCCSS
ncbi:P-loop containing nucleoside triphosphate hydrolase protein [Suillus plorans]|uniref:P-loop containing nucleoside triphosphate hydrolase protein n=1 Tax=Suillus plorans TaxID=116603 RepID=A0A9P7DH38_9AGAM|nr:P-loop containing nucleoside triphosphate hydrolase protein [Suillus plorans]KAG1792432.1 P-loop containing nucleoside triphosphate hydrolase protein [Suillus plorans]